MDYLDRVAMNFGDIQGPNSKKIPQEIQKAVEMAGGRSVFTYYAIEMKKLDVASRVQELRTEEESTIPAVFDQVAKELNVSSSNVSDWYYEVRDHLDDPL